MRAFVQAIHWIFTSSHWDQVSFQTGIRAQLAYHVELSAISVVVAASLAVPVGLLVGHKRRGQFLAVSVANVGRAIPSFALLVLAFIAISNLWPSLGFSMLPTAIALVLLDIQPILKNKSLRIYDVDADKVEVCRGMGGTELW